jgi:DNA-directed RNA polymerase subunit RPC12/RpoP
MVRYFEQAQLEKGDHFYTCAKCRKTVFSRVITKEGRFDAKQIVYCPLCGEKLGVELSVEGFKKLIGEV